MPNEQSKKVEYLHKHSKYIFPAKTKIFLNNNKLTVEINGKNETKLSQYSSDKIKTKASYKYKIGLPITEKGSHLVIEYQEITDYLNEHPQFDFFHFDYSTSHELVLCTFFKSTYLDQADNIISDIKRDMPYLLNIFKRPLIHLKDVNVIQSLDMVKHISHNTIEYLSEHPDDMESIQNDKVTPFRLLTRVYDDDYSIYENIVFRDLIDKILQFLYKRIYNLNELLDIFNDNIQLDAVNRTNHPKYFLAIGKLFLGFTELKTTNDVSSMLEDTKQLYMQLNRQLNCEVYTKNIKVRPVSSELKKTNILMFHKDYRHVYSLYNKFNKNVFGLQDGTFQLQNQSQINYEHFCQMLVLFAVSNFNWSSKPDKIIYENKQINAFFEYKGWSLEIVNEYISILDFNTIILNFSYKDKLFKLLLIPTSYYLANNKRKQYEFIIDRLYYDNYVFDKYVFLEPFGFENDTLNSYNIKSQNHEVDLFYAILPISISEINSFRRIQKLLLEGMIRSNECYDVCAFCGDELTKESDGGMYLCKKCHTAINIINCEHCQKTFSASRLNFTNKRRNNQTERKEGYNKSISNFYKQEKQFLFRNITDIKDNNFICPYCNKENQT